MSSLPDLLENYSNLILSVQDDENPDPLWHRFFRIQMAEFILSDRTMKFELENALRAYSMIHDKWCELEEYFETTSLPIRNYDNLFKQVFIDFS